jgi:hypothetical protein
LWFPLLLKSKPRVGPKGVGRGGRIGQRYQKSDCSRFSVPPGWEMDLRDLDKNSVRRVEFYNARFRVDRLEPRKVFLNKGRYQLGNPKSPKVAGGAV